MAGGDLRALFVIHRHGARPPLTKDPQDPSQETAETPETALYPAGKEQLRELGAYVNKNYSATASVTSRQVTAFSSDFPRTLLSSRAFLSGLLPNASDDVYTSVFDKPDSDWIIRGYANCPQLEDNFLEFMETDEYKDKEREYAGFVENLAEKLNTDAFEPTFENVFNVYDRYTIIREGYNTQPDGKPVDEISDEDMDKLTSVADWYESSKFFHGTKNTAVAGGLLLEIVNQLSNATEPGAKFRIVEYSAHYPTLLSLLAEMQYRSPDEIQPPADEIPGFGAALFIELRTGDSNDGGFRVFLKWFPGGNNDPEDTTIPISRRCGSSNLEKAAEGCPWDDFRDQYTPLIELDEFCRACKSDQGACVNLNSRGLSKAIYIIIGLVVGIVVGILIAIFSGCFRKRKIVYPLTVSDNAEGGYVGQ